MCVTPLKWRSTQMRLCGERSFQRVLVQPAVPRHAGVLQPPVHLRDRPAREPDEHLVQRPYQRHHRRPRRTLIHHTHPHPANTGATSGNTRTRWGEIRVPHTALLCLCAVPSGCSHSMGDRPSCGLPPASQSLRVVGHTVPLVMRFVNTFRYRHMMAAMARAATTSDASTRSPSRSGGRSWCCCGAASGR